MTHNIDEWNGCYPSNWKGSIVAEAMSHPAKYSSKLIRRIYQHMSDEGWVGVGDKVVDPFGGVALGALDAMRLGLHWYGNELEEKFWKIGNQNIELWISRYGSLPRWGNAHLFNGDSRKLVEILNLAGVKLGISSPPYAETDLNYKRNGLDFYRPYMDGQNGIDNYGRTPGQLGGMKAEGFELAISSPPFLQSEGGTPEPKPGGQIDAALYKRHAAGNASADGYGSTDGQLSSMKGDGFEAAISSPPFGSQERGEGIAAAMRGESDYPLPNSHTGKHGYQDQAESTGNLATMPVTNFEAAVSSPPYNEARVGKESGQESCGIGAQYGETAGQLGGSDDFWLAARAIVEQVYQVLEPGGHAAWVVKDYVKNKQVVPFCDQWRQLCEAVGFVTLHEHRAMLVHHKGKQATLEGGVHEIKSESKSFFRRLAEKKGSPRIDWEIVYCMEKPKP